MDEKILDEKRVNKLLNAFKSMDKTAKDLLTDKYKLTLAGIGAQIENIASARKNTKKVEDERQAIIDEISSESNNAITWDSEKREQQRQKLSEKTEKLKEAEKKENSETTEAMNIIEGQIKNLKANIERQRNEIKDRLPSDFEGLNPDDIKIYYQEKILESDDKAEIEELDNYKKEIPEKLAELSELEKAISELEKYIEKYLKKEIDIDFRKTVKKQPSNKKRSKYQKKRENKGN